MKRYPILALAIILCLLLTGCHPNSKPSPSGGIQSDSAEAPSEPTATYYAWLSDELYRICYNQPETLASTMSCFPSLLRACGVDTDDPLIIDELLSTGENGGKLQEDLLAQLRGLLDDPATQKTASMWIGPARLLGMETIDPSRPIDPSNVRLIWYEDEIDGQIFGISHPLPNGEEEFGLFYLPGGFQRVLPATDSSVT